MVFVNNWHITQNSAFDQLVKKLSISHGKSFSEEGYACKNALQTFSINNLKSEINLNYVEKSLIKKSSFYNIKRKKNANISFSAINLKSSNNLHLPNEEMKNILIRITFYLTLTQNMLESSEASALYVIMFEEDDCEIIITYNKLSFTLRQPIINKLINDCNQSSNGLNLKYIKCISNFIWNLFKLFAYVSFNHKLIRLFNNFKLWYIFIFFSPYISPILAAQNIPYRTPSSLNAANLSNPESLHFINSFQHLAHIVMQKFQGLHILRAKHAYHVRTTPKKTFSQVIKSEETSNSPRLIKCFESSSLIKECNYLYFTLLGSIFTLACILYFRDMDAFRLTFILYLIRTSHLYLMRCIRLSLAFGDALIFRPFSPSTEIPIFYRFAVKHGVPQRATSTSTRTQSNAESESEINSDCELDYGTTQADSNEEQEILDPLEMAAFIKHLYILSNPSLYMSYVSQNDYFEPDVQTLLKWVGAPLKIFKYDSRLSLDEQFQLLYPAPDLYKNGAAKIRITHKRDKTLWKVNKHKLHVNVTDYNKHGRRLSSSKLNQKSCTDISVPTQENYMSPLTALTYDTPQCGKKNAAKPITLNHSMPKKFMGHDNFEEETSPTCSICLEAYEEDDLLWRLPSCRHTYHRHCIYSWVRKNPTCPICRSCIYVDYYYA